MFKVNNKDTRTTPCEHISHIVVVFLLQILNMYLLAGSASSEKNLKMYPNLNNI